MGLETDLEVTNIESLVKLSKTEMEFLKNLDLLSIEKTDQLKYASEVSVARSNGI